MIFRVTQKLARKIGVAPSRCLPHREDPLADWTGHLFIADRVQYIIMTNTSTLYSLVMLGRGITDEGLFVDRAFSNMREYLKDRNRTLFQRLIVPTTAQVEFSKTSDRRVLGSMNDLIFMARVHMVEGQISPFEASDRVNEAPMSFLGYTSPDRAFRALGTNKERPSNNRMDSGRATP